MGLNGVWYVLTRKKVLDPSEIGESGLSRCLNTGDLTALGVGSTLGVGIYILAGNVAKELAGPSVVVSFLLAAIASIFAGLCYAEFGARVPRAGSAYVYSYVCIGEFVAFVVGWNLILEYVIGSASVSRGISLYLDTLLNDTLKDTFKSIAPISVSNMSSYFDILAFCLVVLIGCGLAFGLKQSSMINNIFTVINLCVVIFIIAAGSIKANVDNWFIPESDLGGIADAGKGGFFPFGFEGTLKGAATCFFGFVGFDCIATTGEEVQNPKKSIPLAILLSLSIVFLSYFGVSAIITLMVPYYLQDINAPIPYAFSVVGWSFAKWIVSIGGIFGLIASLFGALFPLPRILYAMASDGLIFRFFGAVSFRFKTPVFGTICASLLTGVMAACFELKHLVNMMSLGTLMAYTVVAASVVVLRYKMDDHSVYVNRQSCPLLSSDETDEEFNVANRKVNLFPKLGRGTKIYESELEINDGVVNIDNISSYDLSYKATTHTRKDVVRQLFNKNNHRTPTRLSYTISVTLTLIFCVLCIGFGLCLSKLWEEVANKTVWPIAVLSALAACMLFLLFCVFLQPQSTVQLTFKVPLVPLIPFLSIFINIYLMVMLDVVTWIRFGIWMAIGIPIYLISLCVYARGSNYVTYVQKSSANGHIKGNLNYAFETMENECKEIESFDDEEKFGTLPKSSIKDVDSIIVNADNNSNDIPPLITSESTPKPTAEEEENINDDTSPDTYGDEIIQMFDQVLQDAENDSAEPFDSSEDSKIENISDAIPNDEEISKNVVAIVHQEDDDKKSESKNSENNAKDTPEPVTSPPSVGSIPAPPPMDEDYFNNTKTFTKFKAPGVDPSKKNERVHIKAVRKSSLDETNSNILTKSELINKLNSIYSPKNDAKKGSFFPSAEVYGGPAGLHRSEPNLGSILKRENIDPTLSIVPISLDDESHNSNINNSKDSDKVKPQTDNSSPIPNTKVDEDTKADEEEEAPMKVEDIKKKLESIFSKTPKMQRAKAASDTENGDAIKPKQVNFSNTMKLQRERYENVLKSFEQARNSVDSIEIPPEQKITIPRARMSILKSDSIKK